MSLSSTEKIVKGIRRKPRRKFSTEEKTHIVLDGLRGESSIAELCRKEGINQNLYYRWSKDFLEADKKRLSGDTVREANADEVTGLKSENKDLKQAVTELYLRNDGLKKQGMEHTRGVPHHPQTQGKIERYHRSMKNVVKLEHDYYPWELGKAIAEWVEHYNHQRYHESLDNVTPADVYDGRRNEILDQRAVAKARTMTKRKVHNLRLAGYTGEVTGRKVFLRQRADWSQMV